MKPGQSGLFSLSSIGISSLVLFAIFGVVKPDPGLALVLIFLHSAVVVFILGANLYPLGIILILGFLLRLVFLYLDLATDISVFSSGQDTENFYEVARLIFEQPNLITTEMYGGVFPKVIGVLFWLVGPSRELIQYLNILLAIASLILMGLAARKIGSDPKNINLVLLICAIMPISASISAIFLRESLITFFVALSVFFFCSWLKEGGTANSIGSLLSLAVGGIFHLGVFGIVFGYILAYFMFDYTSGKIVWSLRRLLSMLPIMGGFILVISTFSNLFLEKLETVSSTADVLTRASISRGGSAYLPGIEVNSIADFILFGGLKALLLLVSPPPWVWRGVTDIASFTFDGLFFLLAIWLICRGFRYASSNSRSRILALLTISILSVALVIGAGTGNSGTAMRHRQKVVPLIAVTVMFALPESRRHRQLEDESFLDFAHSNDSRSAQ